jgi:membrane-associated phospholipid phosphatase
MKITMEVTTGPTPRKSMPAGRRFGPALASGLFLCAALSAAPCRADEPPDRSVLNDTKLYVTAPLRWDTQDWMEFAGTVFAIGVAHEFDESVRHAFEPSGGQPLDGQDPHSTRDAIPAAALLVGTWAYGAFTKDHAEWHEAWNMAEAAGFSAVDTVLLKYAGGRLRPNETTSPDQWFQGGDSFPSMHSSMAFAIGTVFAESGDDEHRWLRRTIGYGIAGATALVRLHDNVHWFSDVVTGAAIGISTARFTMNRDGETTKHSAFSVVPVEGGAMLTYLVTR